MFAGSGDEYLDVLGGGGDLESVELADEGDRDETVGQTLYAYDLDGTKPPA
jgi:hypothetical protein